MLAADSILILSPWCKSALAFASFTMLVISQSGAGAGVWRFLSPALHLAAMYAALRLESDVARVVVISWLFLSLELTGRRSRSVGLVQMHWAGLLFAGFLLCYMRVDAMWSDLRSFGRMISWSMPTGLWVSAFQVYLMGMAAALIGLASGRLSLRAVAGGGIVVVLLWIGFLSGRSVLSALTPVEHADVSALQGASIVCVALIIAGAGFRRPDPRRIAVVSSMLTAAIIFPGFLFPPLDRSHHIPDHTQPATEAAGSVGFYSEGLLDWRVPDMERLGLANSGMFGILRHDLDQWTHAARGRVVDSDSISDEFLSGLHVLIFINPSRQPAQAEIASLERFIRDGNAMLVLGDHTDIGNSRRPLNGILAFTGIRFNFDSAIPHRHGWRGCLEIRPHPATSGIEDDVMMQLGVGASLEIEGPAVPLVIARYGFSDAGDPANGGRSGFMGNTRHECGEAVGDLVLVACQHVGKGRVLVFGDTSPFQNAALLISRRLVGNCVEWLAGHDRTGDGLSPGYPAAVETEVVIDFSLKPDVNLELFSERSLGGLANCLARAGITPVPALERSRWNRDAPFLFLINPTETVGAQGVKWLFDYMTEGGNVVLSKGHASPQPVDPILSELSLGIDPVPLGGGDSTSALAHKEAWALSLAGAESTEVRSRAFGYPTVATRRIGAGTLTLIADGRFVMDENLESEWRGDPVNINFIINLIRDLKESARHAEAQTN
jgi:hypothetical protein